MQKWKRPQSLMAVTEPELRGVSRAHMGEPPAELSAEEEMNLLPELLVLST
jgi:hypothetical protein